MPWQLDTAHSLVEFSIKHMMVSTVKGRFKKFSGTFDLDEQNPGASRVDVTIDPTSIDTGDENRDAHLRTADFFEVEKYPQITYTSKQVRALGDDRYHVIGDLSMHGVTREVPLEVTLEGQTTDMQGHRRAGFSAQTSFSRKDFDLHWNVALETGGVLVSDKVNINIEAEVVAIVDARTNAAAS